MLGELIRKKCFWVLDFLRGGLIKKRAVKLNDIKRKNRGNPEALEKILKHAIETVPYYKEISEPVITSFPVVSKKDYCSNFELFRSQHYLNEEKLHKVFTSGSTGTPFMAYQDREKILWHRAGLINLNNSIDWNLGERFLFFRVWGVSHEESKFSQFMSNTIPVNVIDFNDEKKKVVRQKLLKDNGLHLILGYASAVESLADYLLRYNEKYNIKLVISDSEHLSKTAKEKIEKVFQCTVLNRYGNNENGIIGLSMPNDNRMHINFPEYYVELLEFDSDRPVKLGNPGRIVITDLYNKAFPFIRYDTGDVGIADEMFENQCVVLKTLLGRVSNSLRDTKGQLIGESSVTAYFENIVGIKRYQVVQKTDKQYEIRIENEDNAMDDLLKERAKKAFGEDAQIQISHVKKIHQGKNGKYKITSYEVEK